MTSRVAIHVAKEETRKRIEGKRALLKDDGVLPPPTVPNRDDIEKDLSDDEIDPDRFLLLHQTQEKMDKVQQVNKRKLSTDLDVFGDEVQHRSFKKRRAKSDQLFDEVEYENQKNKLGDDFYCGLSDLSYGQEDKVEPKKIDQMIDELKEQEVRRSKFSRRRTWFEDSDIDYINERNRKFNLKAERAFGRFTSQIKDSLERGTAL